MIKMGKAKSNDIWIGAAAVIIVVAYFSGALSSYGLKPPSTLAIGTTGTTTSTSTSLLPTSTTVVQACNPLPKVALSAVYYNASANSGAGGFTQVATGANVFTPGYANGQQAYFNPSGGLSATAPTNFTVGCGVPLTFGLGDNNNVYVNQSPSTYTTTTNPVQTVTGVVKFISAPTLSFKNATTAGFGSRGQVDLVSNNQVLSGGQQISLLVQAGAQCFGNPNYALQFAYNSQVVSSISIPGYSQVTATLPSETSAPSGASYVAFQVPGICTYATQVINPTIQLSTVPASWANVANTAVSVYTYLVPQVNYIYNGQVLMGLYVKPGTQTAIGTVTASKNTIAFGTL